MFTFKYFKKIYWIHTYTESNIHESLEIPWSWGQASLSKKKSFLWHLNIAVQIGCFSREELSNAPEILLLRQQHPLCLWEITKSVEVAGHKENKSFLLLPFFICRLKTHWQFLKEICCSYHLKTVGKKIEIKINLLFISIQNSIPAKPHGRRWEGCLRKSREILLLWKGPH